MDKGDAGEKGNLSKFLSCKHKNPSSSPKPTKKLDMWCALVISGLGRETGKPLGLAGSPIDHLGTYRSVRDPVSKHSRGQLRNDT